MPLLPPTVGERLARCEQNVEAWGIVPGATVDLLIDGGVAVTEPSPGSYHVFTLGAPLNAGQSVTVRQTVGPDTSPASPAVLVGDVEFPIPPPHLAPALLRCAHCLYADGMAPGSKITMFTANEQHGRRPLGSGTVNRFGYACFDPVFIDDGPVFGIATTCGTESAVSPRSFLVLPPAHFSAPHLHDPIFGCQSACDLDTLTQSTTVEIFADGVSLGTFCNCWNAVHVNLPRALMPMEVITAKQAMIDVPNGCNSDGDLSNAVTVVPPDARIKPALRAPLWDGDTTLRVTNQIDGADLTVLITTMGAEGDAGHTSASQYEEVSLGAPLVAGQSVRVRQSLCGHDETSDPVVVQPRPAFVAAPVVRPPLYDCGVLVTVDGTLAGAQVRVFQNGFLIGFAWASSGSTTVRVGPGLVNGRSVTARQRVGGTDTGLSPAVVVQALGQLPAPSITPPLYAGARTVRVDGVVPSAFVTVSNHGVVVGTADASGTFAVVGISVPLDAHISLTATQTLCATTSPSSTAVTSVIADPSVDGPQTPSAPADTTFTPDFTIPATADGPAVSITITGELTFPEDPMHPGSVDPSGAPYPFVLIAHGRHAMTSPSYQGYRYLTRLLASNGIICFSINLNPLNGDPEFIDARARTILEALRLFMVRNTTLGDILNGMIDPSHIGLVGHSRGAEAVVEAQVENAARAPMNRFAIQGVVPIAPTNFLNDRMTGSELFLIYGSFDNDVDGSDPGVEPFWIYDHADSDKSMIFIHHARHNGFNEVWSRPFPEDREHISPGTLSPGQHQAIAKAYINAFFQRTLFGRTGYEPFVNGAARPPGLEGFEIETQFSAIGRITIDNFGDADPQAGIAAEMPLVREHNTRGQAISFTDLSMTNWFDANTQSLSNNPHDTDAGNLTWSATQTYTSGVDNADVRAFAALSVRIGQQFTFGTDLNPPNQSQDLLVTLATAGGNATVRAGSFAELPYVDVRDDGRAKAPLRTVRIPLIAFSGVNPMIRLDAVTGVALQLGTVTPGGAVTVDDIHFTT